MIAVYRASRTPAGQQASASHTTSMAGDYRLFEQLARQAGIVVMENLDDMADWLTVVSCLDPLPRDPRIAVISNAGFECVAAADQGLALAPIEAHLEEKLRRLLTNCRLQGLVKIDNPFDVTPMMNDACFAEAVAVLLEQYDFVVVGCVPLTPALATLPEEWRDTDIVQSLQQLGTHRRMITVIEGGPRYQPMRDALKSTNIPVFNRMDRAVRALQSFFHPLN